MSHTGESIRVLRYTLAVSTDPAEYSAINTPYSVEDMVIDETASYLYTLRYVVHVDMRRAAPSAIRPSLYIHQRRNR